MNQIPMTCVVQASHAYETEPAYGIETNVVNAVVEIRTELAPIVLIDQLLDIERQLKRVRDPRLAGHGPRTIDCDLCFIEDEQHAGPKLTLPHPHLGERDYVLVPMEDLMHDPVRYLMHAGVPVYAPEDRVGHVVAEAGELDWQ
jgi:2-amino-4-hydroxy-6-hydroxymethyldihydropteridine diphosphokinase